MKLKLSLKGNVSIGKESSMEITNGALPKNLVSAKIVNDSVSEGGHRVTTFEVCMHRFVLAEFNTHRVFSRNSASSRAIPVPKRMQEFQFSPAFSLTLPSEKSGMQGGEELQGEWRDDAEWFLRDLHHEVVDQIKWYIDNHPEPETRLHKSVLARYMEPWLWHRVIVTATDWEGFFTQRVSPLAQPEIHLPALLMQEAYEDNMPQPVADGGWHLPYVTGQELSEFETLDCVKLSTARCARVSYLTHDGEYDPEKDIALWDRLITADPPHASPLEHPCRADGSNTRLVSWNMIDGSPMTRELPELGNLLGWTQARHLVLGL